MPAVGRLRYLEAVPPSATRPRGALVLIHAFPLNARMWEPQLALAEGGWHVIAPDLRGMGAGESDPATASVDDYAADVVDLLDALHIEDAAIGGLSLGGYVTFALFRLAPRYFRAMILADTRSQADAPEAVEGRKRTIASVRRKGAAAVADEMLPKLLGEATHRDNPDVVSRVRDLVLSNPVEGIAGALAALMTRPDSTAILSTIRCPTLILVGEQDTVTPPALSEQMQRAIPGSDLTRVANAGHLSSLEQPAAFNGALAHFLEHRV